MDWITTSGGSLDEAKSHALDQLGIVADEAEFDIINDVEKSFFGRVKTEAKVRARVRPKQPSVKEDRNSGRRRSGGGRSRNRGKGGGQGGQGANTGGQNRNGGGKGGNNRSKDGGGRGGNTKGGGENKRGNNRNGENSRSDDKSAQPGQGSNRNRSQNDQNRNKNKGGGGAAAAAATATPKRKREPVEHEMMNREDQEQTATDFLEGVLGAFGMTGAVSIAEEIADDDAIEMAVSGQELGLLVGQKGMTLNALQELTRTVVQREADGAKTNRLRVDVAGYRARRTEALQDFATKIANDVAESGTEKLLEPMGPADRKVVHDTVNDIDGVETGSEGEEPRRRVVIRPT